MQYKNKFLSFNDLSDELEERCFEFNAAGYQDYACEYTQSAIADDLRASVSLFTLAGFTKEEIIDQIVRVLSSVGDGLMSPPNRSSFDSVKGKLKIINPSVEEYREHTRKELNKMSLEELNNFLQNFEHLEMFNVTWEIAALGSGVDLEELANYGFLGLLGGYASNTWTFRDMAGNVRRRAITSLDPLSYISRLIENCSNFIFSHRGTHSAIGEGFEVFSKALRHAKTRLQLDTEKFVSAEDFAFISGLNIRTLANIEMLQPKKPKEGYKILTKDALNFLVNGIKPNGNKIRNKRNPQPADNLLSRNFYSSIWRSQLDHLVAPYHDYNDEVGLDELIGFASNAKDVVYVQTTIKFHRRVSPHNQARVEWIGSGKTFNEINASNSTYRRNIKRLTYHGNSSSIFEDLKYDLKKGWIKEV